MTDHSLQGYLSRRTTEELQSILRYCLQEENHENYKYVVLEILDMIQEREAQEPGK